MLVVHHLENSRSQRVLWMLEEFKIPYTVRRYERNPKTLLAPPALCIVHPLGKSPVIDDDGNVVAETGAIIEYLAEKSSRSPGRTERAGREAPLPPGSMMPPLLALLALLVLKRLGPLAWPGLAPVRRFLVGHLAWLETELTKRQWFAGDHFTGADIMMSFPLEAVSSRHGLGDDKPRLHEWLTRIHERPAYLAALVSGGPYSYASDHSPTSDRGGVLN